MQSYSEATRYRVPVPDHVPAEAVIELDYHTFGGDLDPAFAGDHQLAWKRLQEDGGPELRWTPLNGGHWIAMRAQLIGAVLDQPDLFSSRYLALPKEVGAMYRFIPLSLDPPEHGLYRALLVPLLTAKVVHDKEAHIRGLADALIDTVIERGHCDYVAEFANILPISIFHQLVDFPTEERERLRRMAYAADAASAASVAAMLKAIGDFVAPLIARRRRHPGTDLISALLKGEPGGRPITDEEALHMCQQLFIGGFHTTAGSLGFITLHLARNPALQRELRARPERIKSRVNELMRRFSLVGIPRTATRDCTLGGQHIRAGDAVYLPLVLFNFDEQLFQSPLDVDFERKPVPHVTFGRGIHKCPGQALGMTEIALALEAWLIRVPEFRLDETIRVRIKGGSVGGVENLPLRWD
jgi:cytochrome P450